MDHEKSDLSPGWRLALKCVNEARRWIFLSLLTLAVPMLVGYRGGTARA